MSTPFDAQTGLILVPARIWGPTEKVIARLALDTGATTTLIGAALLRFLGYDPGVAPERVRVTTGSGVEFAASVCVDRIEALGHDRTSFRCSATRYRPPRAWTACWAWTSSAAAGSPSTSARAA